MKYLLICLCLYNLSYADPTCSQLRHLHKIYKENLIINDNEYFAGYTKRADYYYTYIQLKDLLHKNDILMKKTCKK